MELLLHIFTTRNLSNNKQNSCINCNFSFSCLKQFFVWVPFSCAGTLFETVRTGTIFNRFLITSIPISISTMDSIYLSALQTASILQEYPDQELQKQIVFRTKESLKEMEKEMEAGGETGKLPYSTVFAKEIERKFKIKTAVSKFR